MIISSKHKFYLGLLWELVISPYEYAKNFVKWHYMPVNTLELDKVRLPVNSNTVAVCIHEWGGYQGKRSKHIKNITPFDCGLDFQLMRYRSYKGQFDLDLTLTISDYHLFKTEVGDVKILKVPNIGMDFSGYEAFFESIKHKENQFVILTNTSVNKNQVNFIDDYLKFFEAHSSIGMLGISFNSKMYQSLIRNNFNPHLQSFFLLTTTEVLKEVVEKNKEFPGKGIDHKLGLIKNGEIKLSKIVMDLGYQLVAILEDGSPHFFDKRSLADNGKNSWDSVFGDYRLHIEHPNSINPLKKNIVL